MVKTAKKANPDSASEIDALAAASTTRAAAEKIKKAAEAGIFRGWTGRVEVGGGISTGNTVDQRFTGLVDIEKKTPTWEHDLNMTVDLKSEDGETTTARYFLAVSSRRKLTRRLYAVGVLWGESDRFAGYNYRFSEGVGLGYRFIDTPGLQLKAEAGPAIRQAAYISNDYQNTVAARLAGYLGWRLGSNLEFTQSLITYLEDKNSTLLSSTALTTKLQGNISAKASYEVRNEADPPQGRKKTDTTSRVTLVFGF